MVMNRRRFLERVAMGTGAVLGSQLLPRRAVAAGADRNFVFAYFGGGWDTLLCLDPRDPNVFTEERIGQTRVQLAWDRIPASFDRSIIMPAGSNIDMGPTMGGIAQHFDKMCIVRGVSMDTVTHQVGMRYFLTGMTPRGLSAAGSNIGTHVAAQQGDLTAVPNLVSRVESYNEGLPTYATGLTVNGPSDLLLALQDGAQAPQGAVRSRLDEYRARSRGCDPAALDRGGVMSLIRETQTKARGLVTSGIANLFNFANRNDPEIADLVTRYQMGNNPTAVTPGSQAALAFQAIKHGAAQSVTIQLVGGLDTHDDGWADDHPNALASGFTALGQLVTDLRTTAHAEGGTLLDRTTIVAFSEFGRTALLNTRDGRDHSLTSACLLLGAGVPHNKVIGASTLEGMNPMAIDPNTGAPVDSGGVGANPNNVLASVLASAGYNTDKLRSDGLPCLIA